MLPKTSLYIPHCWKSHALAQLFYYIYVSASAIIIFSFAVIFSDRVISRVSSRTKDDLYSLAGKLNLSKEVVKQCKSKDSDLQINQAWYQWQHSDSVIDMGPEAAKYCLKTMESIIGKDGIFQELKLKLQ